MDLKKLGMIDVTVTKRVNNTPKEINQYLKNHKGNLTISQITSMLDLPKTQVEHYFRTDKYRAIPNPATWIKLKGLLALDDMMDSMVMEMEQKQMEYETTRRVYDSKGISPTLESTKTSVPNINVSMQTNGTNTQQQSTKRTSESGLTQGTSEQLTLADCQTSTCSLEDFLARLFQLLGNGKGLKIHEALSSLILQGYSIPKDLNISFLKMSKDCFHTITEIPSGQYSGSLMNLGMTFAGKCLTARISECRRIGKECSLSDILEDSVDPKYFLSEQQVKSLTAGIQQSQIVCKVQDTPAEITKV